MTSFEQRKHLALFLTVLSVTAFFPTRASAGFTNAGFESSSFVGWTIGSYTFPSPLSPYPPTSIAGLGLAAASSNGFTTIVTAGTDTYSNGNLHYPLYGSDAAVVNFGGSSATASSIFQTATMASSDVDPSDNKIHVRFAIAPVLENPSHPPNEQPFFAVEVKDVTKGSTLYFQYNYAGQVGVPWLTGQSGFQYTNWQAIDIAPGAGNLDVGDTVSIQVVASRCEPGGHHGYVYVDAGNTGTFVPSLLVATAANTSNAYRGTNLVYTYSYSNGSASPINNVQVAATLPTGTTFVSTTGANCSALTVGSSGTETCSLGTLAADASGSFTITVLVTNAAVSPLNNGTYPISGTGAPTILGPLVETPIPDFSLSGPSGGALNISSTNFTVSPNTAYTGTITLTPAGAGLSTPIVLTYYNSSAPQSFTITPVSPGPVTLTPANNGSLINPSSVTYATPPAAPTIGPPTAGIGSASVSFTAPGVTGGSVVTTYTATCNPGAVTGTGPASPITVSGLTNGTAYTCSVTATNVYGTGPASSASNSVTPGASASNYTFTGPSGGALNTVSSTFTVSPNAAYSGTVTITPSGGGLSTPMVLTFSNSVAPQTFTLTPTAVGPITLTPTNNGSLPNPSALIYATPSAAPVIGTAYAENAAASVRFTGPSATGGSAITNYTAVCNPGAVMGTGSSSPITVSGLTNGTAYTCSVTATNAYGTSAASAVSNSFTPSVPASRYTLTGPSGGTLNQASSAFTITPNALYSGSVTITPSGGGLSTPVVLTFSDSAAAQTFTITPTAVGPVTLTPSNSGSLTNPTALMYDTPSAAPTIGVATGGNGSASVAFTAPAATGGSPDTAYTATCNPGAVTGTASSSPIIVSGLTNGTAYTCSVTATNAYGTSAASAASNSVTPVAPASSYTFTGPGGGTLNTVSSAFTVTPNALYTGTVTITPAGGGLSTPVVLTFSNSAAAQTFTVTPTAVGPVTLRPSNSGSLTNPTALMYDTPSAAPTIGAATAGNGSASVAFTAPTATGGSPVTNYTATCNPGGVIGTGSSSPIVVSGLTNGTAYTCSETATNAYGISAASAASNSVTPVAPASSYTFTGPSGGTLNMVSSAFTITPNAIYTGNVTITPVGGGLSTPLVLTFSNSAAAQTFTVTPTTAGPVTLTPSNSESLSDPTALTYDTPSDAPTIGLATAGNGSVSVSFTPPINDGGSPITGYTVDCNGYPGTGASSPIMVSGLTNGTAYTCSVTATNGFGPSVPSTASNSVTPVAPASSFALSGPSGGAIGLVSAAFTVTPDALYSGTITITPSGGGLSTLVVLTFSNSAVPQTFTVTPTTIGPVTLTASNNGSLSNPEALTYATPSDTPTIGTATAGNGAATITFTDPGADGGSLITGYTVDCGGGLTSNGASSPLTVSGLTNGIVYTCSVTATNGVGTSAPSGPSNPVTPVAPANSYTLAGPSSGLIGAASTAFTVTPNALYSGSITITPSGGGLSAPLVLTFNNSAAPQTFTILPTGVGRVSLLPSNNGSLSDPTALTYATPPDAPVIGIATAANALVTVAFTAPLANGGSAITGYSVDCGGGHTAAGATSPITLTGLINGTLYACSVTATNAVGTGAPSADSNSVTPSGLPGAPGMGIAVGGNADASVSFTPPVDDGGAAITGYVVTSNPGNLTGAGTASPIAVSGLSNGIPYTFTITATNSVGTGPPSAVSNSVILVVPASNYNFTGPSGGTLNVVSSAFTITPNALYTGTVIITPSGGGLSTPVVLTFSNSAAAQTFTIIPTAVGPVTLTPSNSGSLTNPTALMYDTPSAAPTIGVATAGNGSASVAFIAPAATGGSPDTAYTATCNPGAVTGTASSSPIIVLGLTNGTAYTCSVTATNAYGISAASAPSNSVTPIAPASSYTFTGPSGGNLNMVSSAFTITPNALYTGTVTITPAGGGLSTAILLTFSNSAVAQTFTVTPTAVGPVTLTPSNSGSLTNPIALMYDTPSAAPTIGAATAENGSASVAFTAPAATGGSPVTNYTATCNPGGVIGTGSSSPIVVSGLTNGTAYTCSVTATNAYGISAASATSNSVTPVAPASSYTFTGPGGGNLNMVSSAFTITPNALYTGTVTITPAGGGLSTPVVLTFSNSAAAQTLTVTPTAVGPVTLTPSNSGSFTNPTALMYDTPSAAPTIGAATGGNGSASVAFTAPAATGGSPVTTYTAFCNPGAVTGTASSSPITVSGLTNGTAYTCSVTATNAYGTSAASAASNSITPTTGLPGTPQSVTAVAGNAQATVTFNPPPSNGGSANSSYTVTSSPGRISASGPQSPLIVTGLTNGTAYTFTVSAINSAGTGPASTPSNSVTPENGVPGAPQLVRATAGNAQATVTFTPPATSGTSVIVGYTVVSNPGGRIASGSASPLTVTGLNNGTAYTFTVSAKNSEGTGIPSAASNSVIPFAPLTFSTSFPTGIAGSDYPLQTLTATGGIAPYTLEITSGSLPPGLTLVNSQFGGIPTVAGDFGFTIAVIDASGMTVSSSSSIVINPSHIDLIISQTLVPFSVSTGSSQVPTPANVTVRSSVIQQLLNYSVTVSPPVSWLDVTGGGSTPGSIGIVLDPSALSLAAASIPYQATIFVACVASSPCAGNVQTINVSLTVTDPPPQLLATSGLVSFETPFPSTGSLSQPLGIQNAGGGTLTIASVTTGDAWLSVSGVPSALPSGPAVPINVSVNPAGLSAGYYLSSITVSSASGSVNVPVSMSISGSSKMILGPAGEQFQSIAGSSPGQTAGSSLVSVSGSSTVSWTASVLPGSPWLSVNSQSGTASFAAPSTLSFSINPALSAALAPNTYHATIRISSPDVTDSPLDFSVILNVAPAMTPVKPDPSPAGLVFVATSKGRSVAAQNIQVYAGSNSTVAYQASAFTGGKVADWLSVGPSTGSSSSSSPAVSSVSVNPANLAPGVYNGDVSYAFASAAVRTVNATLIVKPAQQEQSGCVPQKLVLTQIGLVDNFEQFAGLPTAVSVFALDDCGAPVTDSQVVAYFSNGDPPLPMTAVNSSSGVFIGTWTPRSLSPQATVTVNATTPNLVAGSTTITGQITASAAPLLAPNATLHVFYSQVGGSLAPGTVVTIYGSNLSGMVAQASSAPLPTALGSVSVLIGGIAAPLFYVSPGQINAQIPFELTPAQSYQVRVNNNGALSTPDSIQLEPVSPGIAAYESGQIIAQRYPDYSLVTQSTPAQPGDYLTIYLAGLGATDQPVLTGTPSPYDVLAHPLIAPTLSLNGISVPIAFAGLTPGGVGLYQINFQVPADTPDGDLPLLVTQHGANSNTVILSVQH